MAGGRPSDYKEEYNEQAYKLCLLGHIDSELANFFEVTEQTINNWKKDYPEFFESVKAGREIANANVAVSLYQRATGYEHPEEKIFNNQGEIVRATTTKKYPPETKAIEMWLHNRCGDKFAKKVEIDNKHSGEVKSTLDVTQLKDAVREVLDEDDC